MVWQVLPFKLTFETELKGPQDYKSYIPGTVLEPEEHNGGSHLHLPLHSISIGTLLVYRAAGFQFAGEACGLPMAVQTSHSLPSILFWNWCLESVEAQCDPTFTFNPLKWCIQFASFNLPRYLYGLAVMAMTVANQHFSTATTASFISSIFHCQTANGLHKWWKGLGFSEECWKQKRKNTHPRKKYMYI